MWTGATSSSLFCLVPVKHRNIPLCKYENIARSTLQKQISVKPQPEELVAAEAIGVSKWQSRKEKQTHRRRRLVRFRSRWRSPHSKSVNQWLPICSRSRCSPNLSRRCRGLSPAPAPRRSWPPSGSPEPHGATGMGAGARGEGGIPRSVLLQWKRITKGRRRMSPTITTPFWVW